MFPKRSLIAVLFALTLALAVAAPASAKTVYDYEYSGVYFDGSSAGKAFNAGIGGIEFDRLNNQLLVANAGTPGWVTRLDATTFAPANFSSLGVPHLFMQGPWDPSLTDGQVAVDQTGGPNSGNIYTGLEYHRGFRPNGLEITQFAGNQDSGCGMAVDPSGETVIVAGRNGMYWYRLDGTIEEKFNGVQMEDRYRVGSPGYEPGTKAQWEERGKACRPVVDGNGDIYGVKGGFGNTSRNKIVKIDDTGLERYEVTETTDYVAVATDPSNDDVFVLRTAPGDAVFERYDSEGRKLGGGWGGPDAGNSYDGLTGNPIGIAVDPTTHAVWVANRRDYGSTTRRVEKFIRTNPRVIPDTTTAEPIYDHPSGETMTLRGILNPDGVETTDCYFEWGLTQALGEVADCEQGDSFSGTDDQVVTAKISTEKGVRYFYKLFAENPDGLAPSDVEAFLPQGPIKLEFTGVDRVNTDGARFRTRFDPNGGNGSFHFEYGQNGVLDQTTPESDTFGFRTQAGLSTGVNVYEPGIYEGSQEVIGLTPGQTYEYRAVLTNEAGTIEGPVKTLTTYLPDPGTDPCPNAQVRQQVGASLVADCRAYELVSVGKGGGYDVVSDIVAGQTPFSAYPRANDKFLYSVHAGLIPGVGGVPTNHGRDPYLATRGPDGWSTRYVGLPADGMASDAAFGSPLLGADSSLATFAFGGSDICDPCFGDDNSINVPLRLPDGSLVKGMTGGANPAADPVGEVRAPLSADGSTFVFGSDQVFDPAADSGTRWIYKRDLGTDATSLVSTLPNGDPISGEVAELDISDDGSRVLVGKVVGEDSLGNRRYDLYMHLGSSPSSVEVADTPGGVIFNGMTGDGSQVFFTTDDQLGDDADTSADFFKASVGVSSPAPIARLSTGSGGTGNTDACAPVTDWNVVAGGPDCSTVAFAGGAGIARGDGTAYFVSPELLDGGGNGTAGQVNLYLANPGGVPHFVGLLDSSLVKPGPQPPDHPVADATLVSGLATPEAMTVDQSNGDLYVVERTGARLSRFSADGVAKNFTEGAATGTNRLTGLSLGSAGRAAVAVNNAPGSAFEGSILVKSANGTISFFAPSGNPIGSITGYGDACGVAIDQSSGVIYVGDRTGATVWRLVPTSSTTPVSNANFTKTGVKPGFSPCAVAADSLGNVYAGKETTSTITAPGPIVRFSVSDFTAVPATVSGTEISSVGTSMTVDPDTDELYINERSVIGRYNPGGATLIQRFGVGSIGSQSRGIAIDVDTKHVYAPEGEYVVEFGVQPVPYIPIDQPGVRHGVRQPGIHSFEDFQVTPDGRYAAFSSAVSLTGAPGEGLSQLFRYDADTGDLDCASCAPSGAIGASNIRLTPHGLNLTDAGEIFFTAEESFALRDTNEKADVYKWADGKIGLITTGVGQFNSTLAGVGADGVNAFFFTRETLSAQDQNGPSVKLYVARKDGGYLEDPPRPPCAASDECHGPGTQAPPRPDIRTVTGSPNPPKQPSSSRRCAKGKVLRKGRCVRRKADKKAQRRKAQRRKARNRKAKNAKRRAKRRGQRRSTGRRG